MQNVDHQHAQNTQYRSGVDVSVGGRVGGRPRRRAFHKMGTNGNLGDTQPRLTIRLSSPCHLDPVICSHGERCPRFRLISHLCRRKKVGAPRCAWLKVRQFPTSWVLLGKAGKTGTRPRPEDPHPCR